VETLSANDASPAKNVQQNTAAQQVTEYLEYFLRDEGTVNSFWETFLGGNIDILIYEKEVDKKIL
jgi:hypothetical protein